MECFNHRQKLDLFKFGFDFRWMKDRKIKDPRRLLVSVLKGIWIYCLLLWVYIVADSFLFPAYQFLAISQYIPIPENLIADLAFPASFVCFVAWDYLRKNGEAKKI